MTSMNGRSNKPVTLEKTNKTLLDYKGLKVEEFTINDGEEFKLVMCREPFEKVIVDGLPNFLFHENFKNFEELELVRERIRKELEKHYHLDKFSATEEIKVIG